MARCGSCGRTFNKKNCPKDGMCRDCVTKRQKASSARRRRMRALVRFLNSGRGGDDQKFGANVVYLRLIGALR